MPNGISPKSYATRQFILRSLRPEIVRAIAVGTKIRDWQGLENRQLCFLMVQVLGDRNPSFDYFCQAIGTAANLYQRNPQDYEINEIPNN